MLMARQKVMLMLFKGLFGEAFQALSCGPADVDDDTDAYGKRRC